jgi:hypothetical protein
LSERLVPVCASAEELLYDFHMTFPSRNDEDRGAILIPDMGAHL